MIPVAVYCRVSTDKEDQANSFEAQQRYFSEQIRHKADWKLFDIYADEGITGTSTRKRHQFNRMISDAISGKFKWIITKEVSRFSRNILDTIHYTRKLKAVGVGVLFITDGISTMDADSELRLSIMASLAQEESRRTSARVTWGQTRQMEQGVVFGHSLLGYDVKNGTLTVNREGAEIVKLIFRKYVLEQMGTSSIASYLTEHHHRTTRGGTAWSPGSIVKILHNEKYAGDLIQKKTYTPDYLTHRKKSNRGEVELIRLVNHHEPIISRELWEQAQRRLRENCKHRKIPAACGGQYLFSGKIRCGMCSAAFVARTKYLKNGTSIRKWCCGTAVRSGTDGCSIGRQLRDDDARNMIRLALCHLDINISDISDSLIGLISETAAEDYWPEKSRITQDISRTKQKLDAVLDSYFSGDIAREEMLMMKSKYTAQLLQLEKQLSEWETSQTWLRNTDLETEIRSVIAGLLSGQTENELFFRAILSGLTVCPDRTIRLMLKNLDQTFVFQ